MAVLHYLLLFLLNPVTAADGNNFISPKYQAASSAGPFGGDLSWDLGSSQLIAFQSTWAEYKIELWQQSISAGSASVSNTLVYDQNAGDNLPQSFYWTVQTYEFQLADSPVFFFWLRDKNSSDQQSSAFFNITLPTESNGPSQVTSSSVTTGSSATSTASSFTTSTSSTSPTTTITPTTTAALGTSTSSTIPVAPVATTTSSVPTPPGGGGLSVGAATGIGVGASLVGLGALVWAGVFCWRKRQKRGDEAMTSRQEITESWAPPYDYTKPQYPPSYHQPAGYQQQTIYQEASAEPPRGPPVELG